MKPVTVFVVDDDEVFQKILSKCLADDGYKVVAAYNAHECLEKLKENSVDLILLDISLPDGNGLVLIQSIRQLTNVPILAISGKNEMSDKVVGLEMGADDYITKPFEPPELKARIRAHLRRNSMLREQAQNNIDDTPECCIRIGKWNLSRSKFQIFDDAGQSGGLSLGEFQLLDLLATSPNKVLSREQILDKTKDDNLDISDRSIDIRIARIRKKIGDDGKDSEIIRTVRNAGYMLVLDRGKTTSL